MRYRTEGLPSFIIKITKFAIGWFDFLGVDFGVMSENILPPSLIVYLFQMDVNTFVIL